MAGGFTRHCQQLLPKYEAPAHGTACHMRVAQHTGQDESLHAGYAGCIDSAGQPLYQAFELARTYSAQVCTTVGPLWPPGCSKAMAWVAADRSMALLCQLRTVLAGCEPPSGGVSCELAHTPP